jgi:hypothetical protein
VTNTEWIFVVAKKVMKKLLVQELRRGGVNDGGFVRYE